jgi:hypothetical protein
VTAPELPTSRAQLLGGATPFRPRTTRSWDLLGLAAHVLVGAVPVALVSLFLTVVLRIVT